MKFGVDYAHNMGNQHYQRRKWNSGIKSFVEEEKQCKTQVINDTQGQASAQRISQRFVTLLKAIVGLLWLKFVRSLYAYQLWERAVHHQNELLLWKISAWWVPKLLSDQQKTARVQISETLLAHYKEEGDAFIHCIVTCDETWVHHYTPQTKRASKEWRGMGEECPVKAKTRLSAGKVMAMFFGTLKGSCL